MITKFIQFSDAVTNGFTAVELQCLDVVGLFFFLIILLWEEVRYLPADLLDTLLLLSLYAMSLSTKPFSILPSVKQIDFILP